MRFNFANTVPVVESEEFEFQPPFHVALYVPSARAQDLLYQEVGFFTSGGASLRQPVRMIGNGTNHRVKYVLRSQEGTVEFSFRVNHRIGSEMMDILSNQQPNVMLMVSDNLTELEEMAGRHFEHPVRYIYLHNENKTPDFHERPGFVAIKQGISKDAGADSKGLFKFFIEIEKTLRPDITASQNHAEEETLRL